MESPRDHHQPPKVAKLTKRRRQKRKISSQMQTMKFTKHIKIKILCPLHQEAVQWIILSAHTLAISMVIGIAKMNVSRPTKMVVLTPVAAEQAKSLAALSVIVNQNQMLNVQVHCRLCLRPGVHHPPLRQSTILTSAHPQGPCALGPGAYPATQVHRVQPEKLACLVFQAIREFLDLPDLLGLTLT